MNTTLTDFISGTWQVLKETTKAESWTATKDAFDQMSKLQKINQDIAREIAAKLPKPTVAVAAAHSRVSSAGSFAGKRPTIRPRELRIGGQKFPISINNQIVIETANWILSQGKKLPNIPGFLSATDSGFSPSAVKKRLKDGTLVEIGLSQETLLKKARQLLNACGLHHVKVEVLFENGDTKAV